MKNARSLVVVALLALGLAGLSRFGPSGAVDAAYVHDGPPEIVAATFSSAWCPACQVLEPRLAAVAPAFADQPVKFVELDFTFGAREETAALAAREGLGDLYPRFKGATGFTLLVDAQTGEIIDMLTINHSKKAMRAAIAGALANAAQD